MTTDKKARLGNPDGSRDEAWFAIQRALDAHPVRTPKRDKGGEPARPEAVDPLEEPDPTLADIDAED